MRIVKRGRQSGLSTKAVHPKKESPMKMMRYAYTAIYLLIAFAPTATLLTACAGTEERSETRQETRVEGRTEERQEQRRDFED
jgi:hypothetical protein